MRIIKKILPHICIIISGMLITFFIIDQFNSSMAFIDNSITKWLLFINSILAIIMSILQIIRNERTSDKFIGK